MLDYKIHFINKIFCSIAKAKTIADLEKIPDDCGIEKKNRMDSSIYPKIEFKIVSEEIQSLLDLKLLDENLNLAIDISSRLNDPIVKILYALAWKNGDLKKLKHIVKGILDVKADTSDQDDALVFYQFGKYLTGEKHQPIIDQHVLRAYGIYQAFKNNDDCERFISMKTVNRGNKALIQSYKEWLRSDEILPELKCLPNYTYHIDKVLFAAGKAVKNQNSFDSSRNVSLKNASKSIRSMQERQERCPELNEGARYYPLQEYFRKSAEAKEIKVVLSISAIENLIHHTLPPWAFNRSALFWSNGGYESHVQKRAWLSQGFVVQDYQVNGKEHSGRIVFRNVNL